MARCHIVWNHDKTEGVIFRERPRDEMGIDHAHSVVVATQGPFGGCWSSLAEAFWENSDEGEFESHVQVVEISVAE